MTRRDKIVLVVIAMIMIGGVIGFVWMTNDYVNERVECAESYGGKVTQGYCVYVRNGTSESYDIWSKERPEK